MSAEASSAGIEPVDLGVQEFARAALSRALSARERGTQGLGSAGRPYQLIVPQAMEAMLGAQGFHEGDVIHLPLPGILGSFWRIVFARYMPDGRDDDGRSRDARERDLRGRERAEWARQRRCRA